MCGLTTDATMVNGLTIKCMEKESLHGPTAESMKEITMTTKSKAKVYSPGLMAESTMGTGLMGNNTVKAFIILPKEKSKKENGKKEKELDG